MGIHPLGPGLILHLRSSSPLKLFYTIPLAFNLPSTLNPEVSPAMHPTQNPMASQGMSYYRDVGTPHMGRITQDTRGPTAALNTV